MVQKTMIEQPVGTAKTALALRRELTAHYQALVQRIRSAANGSARGQAVGITSPGRRAGVSTVAINVAVSAAQADIGPVLLIDTNIGARCVQRAFRVQPALGLADALAGSADPLDCVEASGVDGLAVIADEGRNRHVVPRIDAAKLGSALEVLNRHFRLLVFDLPAATELTSCFALAGQLDGVILVIEAERADHRAALRTKQQLANAGTHLLGVVFNKRHNHLPGWLYRIL